MCKVLVSVLFLLSFSLTGCVNRFQTYYRGAAPEVVQARKDVLPCVEPESGNLADIPYEDVVAQAFENGFEPVGTSEWEDNAISSDASAREQAKNLGACLVLWSRAFSRNDSGVRVTTRYVPERVTTARTGGKNSRKVYIVTPAHYVDVPESFSIDYYVHKAVYFVRVKSSGLGILKSDHSDFPQDAAAEENRGAEGGSLQSSKTGTVGKASRVSEKSADPVGIIVSAVRRGSKASEAGVLKGDVLLSINGKPCGPGTVITESLKPGNNILKLRRDGQTLTKTVALPDTEAGYAVQ